MAASPETTKTNPKPTEPPQNTWRPGWWDFYPLAEHPHKPLEWSQSSLIFTAHATQPLVVARHYSSSKQFILPAPPVFLSPNASFLPPTLISAQPGDEWLFAYFPRREGDGVGCLWKKGPYLDSWTVQETWNFNKGGGAVAVAWLNRHREWALDGSSHPTRLPTRGVATPLTYPTLVCITQDYAFQLTYLRQSPPGIRTLRTPLGCMTVTSEKATQDDPEHIHNRRLCVAADICVNYSDNILSLVTISRQMPSPTSMTAPPFNSMDLSVSLDLPQSSAAEGRPEWETWGDPLLEFHEINLRPDVQGYTMLLPPPFLRLAPPKTFVDVKLVATPPRLSPSTEAGNPSDNQSDKNMYLVVTSLNLNEYVKSPGSQITVYTIQPRTSAARQPNALTIQHQANRAFENSVATLADRVPIRFNGQQPVLLVAELDTVHLEVSSRTSKATVGKIRALKLPGLIETNDTELAPLEFLVGKTTRELPLYFKLSQNGVLIASLPSLGLHPQASIYRSPLYPTTASLASPLALSVLNKTSPTDITHILSGSGTPVDDVAQTLYATLKILSVADSSDLFTREMLGIALEIYRSKSLNSKDEVEKEACKVRWQTAHDICSMSAARTAFEDCQEEGGYDLEAIWQLIAITTWAIHFIEELAKQCVLFSDGIPDQANLSTLPLLIESTLLHLSHPFALKSLCSVLGHVTNLRNVLAKLPAGADSARVAKTVLEDVFDNSSIKIPELKKLLDGKLATIQSQDQDICAKALAACMPTSSMRSQLIPITNAISTPAILNKAKLFIKTSDLLDGIARLSLSPRAIDPPKDVVTKGVIRPKDQSQKIICLRCGGTSAISAGSGLHGPTPGNGMALSPPLNWKAWEQTWVARCVCGGSWISESASVLVSYPTAT